MNRTKISAGIAGLIVLIAIGTAIHQVRASREAAASLTAAQQENDALAAKLTALQQRVAAADQAAAVLQKSLDDASATRVAEQQRAAKAATAAATAARPATLSTAEGEAFMARHPAVQRAVLAAYRAQTAGQFGPFFKARGFTPAQIEAFENSMMHGAGVLRMVQGADGRTFALSVPTWGDAQKRREEETQLVALIGEAGVPQLREYIQQLPARKLTAQLAGALSFTPTPLTAQQVDQVTRVLAGTRSDPGGSSAGQLDWNAIMSHAQGVLSVPQLAVLGGFQAQEQYNLALNQALRRGPPPDRAGNPSAAPGK